MVDESGTAVTQQACTPPAPSRGDWLFRIGLLASVLLLTYLVLMHGKLLFGWTAANLPLLLPLAVTVLSISTRAGDIRNYEAVLKVSNDIAIGIVSFDIWLLSASRSDPQGRILVNPDTMISGDYAIPFLLAGLVLAVGCVVLTHYQFKSELVKTRCLLVALLVSGIVYIAPFSVLQAVPTPSSPAPVTAQLKKYTVVVPYKDPGITSYAPAFLSSRDFVRIERGILATGAQDAKALGSQRFLESSESTLVKSKTGEKVAVQPDKILAFEE